MTIGTVNGYPSDKFAFPRSYVRSVGVRSGTALAIWTDNRMDLTDPSTGVTYWTYVFKPEFWAWSSNRWTLDWILEESYYIPFVGSPKVPLNVVCIWVYEVGQFYPTIEVNPFPGQPFLNQHVLQGAPPDYWLPPWKV